MSRPTVHFAGLIGEFARYFNLPRIVPDEGRWMG